MVFSPDIAILQNNEEKMNIRKILAFLVICFTPTLVFCRQDTLVLAPAPAPPPIPQVVENPTVTLENGQPVVVASGVEGPGIVVINETEDTLDFRNGRAAWSPGVDHRGQLFLFSAGKGHRMYHVAARKDGTTRLRHIPLWLSVLPPLIAIALALIFKEVLVSLFLGIWVGAFIAGGLRIESLYYFLLSIFDAIQKYVIEALNDSGHLSIIVFSLMIGGMVAVISRNGGMAGVVKALSRYARSSRSAQFITWLLGVAIFFDDYANTLIVGNTMRPVTDKYRISRAKLAYLVDSTAAPVAAIAFITTWIGAELGYIDDGIHNIAHFEEQNMTAYAIFIGSLKYAFYPILTLAFMLMLIYMRRDFGPMFKSEVHARNTGEVQPVRAGGHTESVEDLSPVEGAPLKWYNAAVPVLLVILVTIFGLLDTGLLSCYNELVEKGLPVASSGWGDTWAGLSALITDEGSGFFVKLGKVIGAADSYVALLWASLTGVIAAILLTLRAKVMRIGPAISTLITGFKTMLPAIMILTLAWSLAATTETLHTATYLTGALADSLNPFLLPPIVFALAAVISFSTGSSWSTMAILYPIVIPLTWAICHHNNGLPPEMSTELLLNVIAVTLAASVLGDHCSPISDTTILSSLASDCNHIEHVRTQLPYALTVGAVSLVAGGVTTGLGGGWAISFVMLLASLGVLFLIVRRFGKRVE